METISVLGKSGGLDWFRKGIEKTTELKYKERLSRDREGGVRVLNRVVSATKEGIEYEVDQRHAEIIIRNVGFKIAATQSATTEEEQMKEKSMTRCTGPSRPGPSIWPRIFRTFNSLQKGSE